VLLAGYGLLAIVYGALLVPDAGGLLVLAVALVLLGGYYAATDGVLTAMAAAILPRHQSGSGLAVLATATSLARLTAAVGYGYLWTRYGVGPATTASLVALAAAIVFAAVILGRAARHVPREITPDAEPAA
jgi:hypothetical protein